MRFNPSVGSQMDQVAPATVVPVIPTSGAAATTSQMDQVAPLPVPSPGFASLGKEGYFPSALDSSTTGGWGRASYGSSCAERPRTRLELELIQISGAIRDRREWWVKIQQPSIVSSWRQEYSIGHPSSIDSHKFELAISEARFFAQQFSTNVAKPAPAEGCFMRDGLPADLQDCINRDIHRLRGFSPVGKNLWVDGITHEEMKAQSIDFHPGSNGMVVDLVHPGYVCVKEESRASRAKSCLTFCLLLSLFSQPLPHSRFTHP